MTFLGLLRSSDWSCWKEGLLFKLFGIILDFSVTLWKNLLSKHLPGSRPKKILSMFRFIWNLLQDLTELHWTMTISYIKRKEQKKVKSQLGIISAQLSLITYFHFLKKWGKSWCFWLPQSPIPHMTKQDWKTQKGQLVPSQGTTRAGSTKVISILHKDGRQPPTRHFSPYTVQLWG